ncbi:hypothetical protein BU25DRAFT_409692 [Macroventuria anomochaeta]|uniref:Uncharacterized protein n=1 Tax=Macroventuria anomochaeta TaxID=301207 RepID=A0ACB6S3Q6_9PLEO|nr:uncharacterized protein BU25DRAFT_409692 [Macroventuria anomochaeta]KAF2628669.1 hypothetical protein BU25DRAFT_409692 [Macroventuria anomochaeta]
MMAAVTGAPPPDPLRLPPSGPTGTASSRHFCIRYPSRELTPDEVAAGHTRCSECRAKHATQTATRVSTTFNQTPYLPYICI